MDDSRSDDEDAENLSRKKSSTLRRRRTSSTPKKNHKRPRQFSKSPPELEPAPSLQLHQASIPTSNAPESHSRILKYGMIIQDSTIHVKLEKKPIIDEFAGVGVWEKFLEEGVVVIPNVMAYILESDLKTIWEEECKLYLHHEEIHGGGSVWSQRHSLIQQLIRQDPVIYLLHVAFNGPDEDGEDNYRFISAPLPLKYLPPHETYSRLGFFLNPWYQQFQPNVIDLSSSVLLCDEDENSSLEVVKGFCTKLNSWKEEFTEIPSSMRAFQLSDIDEKMYSNTEEAKYGSFTRMIGKMGDLRLINAGMLVRESTPQSVRREACPGYVVTKGEKLGGKFGWRSISKQNREMLLNPITAELFLPTQLIRGVWYIGDAIMGQMSWDHPAVINEVSEFFSLDINEKKIYVEKVRRKLKAELMDLWGNGVKKFEPRYYGKNSFWNNETESST